MEKKKKNQGGGILSWLLIAAGIVGILITGIIAAAFLSEKIEYDASKEKLTVEAEITEIEHIKLDPNANAATEPGYHTEYDERVRDKYDVTREYYVHNERYTYTERLSDIPNQIVEIEVYKDSRGHYVRYAGGGSWTGIAIAIGVGGLLTGGFFIYLGADDLIKTAKKKKKAASSADTQ